MSFYQFLDAFCLIFHAAYTLFCITGWIWPVTRKANFVLLLMTAVSWFLLGLCYGIGYCPLTDWHWEIKYKLGQRNLPRSYIKYMIDTITGLNVDAYLVDVVGVSLFFFLLILSAYLNIRDFRKKHLRS
jgi:hypothetical protein